jgi:hypothetical protein
MNTCPFTLRPTQPGTSPAAAARAALALGGSPARLRVLQAALATARPGLADPIMNALASAPGLEGPGQLQLLVSLVLGLEALATSGPTAAGAAAVLTAAGDGAAAAAAATAAVGDAAVASSSEGAAAPVVVALRGAVEATEQHVASALGDDPAAVAAATAAWRALQELAWRGEPGARAGAANWLQRLLAIALEAAGEVRRSLLQSSPPA